MVLVSAAFLLYSFQEYKHTDPYTHLYYSNVQKLKTGQEALLECIARSDMQDTGDLEDIRICLDSVRLQLKKADFWLRYLEPVSYKKVNGPLPVEWETEVFEKFEKPYKREGAGLSLGANYLGEGDLVKDSLSRLIQASQDALAVYGADSVTRAFRDYHHFFLCNRLFLLNLAALYTTGFECPDTAGIIPELRVMLHGTAEIYQAFDEQYPAVSLSPEYLELYNRVLAFADGQPPAYTAFDHFLFIRDYINPLFKINQELISRYHIISRSLVDYTLNKQAVSIFDKSLYNGTNPKGIFLRVKDTAVLAALEQTGKLLFFDPILSGNNQRSCASCHKPEASFTDHSAATALHYNGKDRLARNTPSLINTQYNHLLMQDGSHISLQAQAKAVITNPDEMGCREGEILKKVLSCPDYKKAFRGFLQYTPQESGITLDHILSALTMYYSTFSRYHAPFDDMMNTGSAAGEQVRQGFNLFMGKAQCGTCHFVPQFNGVKPPFVSSEFEVLGVPKDTGYLRLSPDKGRYGVHPARETLHAFRTGSVRNADNTAPYMHNGVFRTMAQVIDFYDAGGGTGKKLAVENQTLSADALHLTSAEKQALIVFIKSLNENIITEHPPERLPRSVYHKWNNRKVGGIY